jgi:hypothetical protein
MIPRLSVFVLSLLLLVACSGGGKTSNPRVGSEHAALTSALLGVNVDPFNSAPSQQDLDAVGATGVRFELMADGRDLPGLYARYDDVIRKLRDPNDPKGVLLIVDYATVSYDPPMTDDYATKFACAAADIASHYAGQVDVIEVWNEPDMPGHNYLSPEDFARVMRATVKAIKSPGVMPCSSHGNPAMTVITGGLGGPDPLGATDATGKHVDGDGVHHYARDFVAAMGTDWDLVDGFGVHTYTHWPESDDGRKPSNNLGWMLGEFVSIADKMLYVTEWGDPSGQPEMVQQTLSMFADPDQSGLVEHIAQAYLFAWSDNMEPCDNGPPTGAAPDGTPTCADGDSHRKRFGLVGGNGKPTDAWQAFHSGAQTIQGHYGQNAPPPPQPPPPGGDPNAQHAGRVHGTITIQGAPIGGVSISAWGHDWQDYKEVTTGDDGIYMIDGLNAGSQYNIVVNGTADENGSYSATNPDHQVQVRNNVELVAGPDGWHGEDFTLDF